MAGEAERQEEVTRFAEITVTYRTTESEHEALSDQLLDALADILSPSCHAGQDECGPDCKFELATGVLHPVGWEDEEEAGDETIISKTLATRGVFTPDETASLTHDIIMSLMTEGYAITKHNKVGFHV